MKRLLLTAALTVCVAGPLGAVAADQPQPRYPEGESAGRAYDFTHPTKPWRRDHGTEGWRRTEQLLAVNPFYYIWWESATKKVPRFFPQHTRNREVSDRANVTTGDNEIRLSGVRGEKVSFQIAVSRRREQHVHIKSVAPRALQGPSDAALPMERIAVNQVGFVNKTDPDVLFPMPEFQPEFDTVPYGENAIFWITIDIPRDIEPGTYKGPIRITLDDINAGDAGGTHELALSLEVSPVVLPRRTHVQTMNIRLWSGIQTFYDHPPEKMPEFIAEQFFPLLAENRMSNERPQPLTGRWMSRVDGVDWDWMSERGVKTWTKWAHWWDDKGLYIGRIPFDAESKAAIREWNQTYGQIVRENNWTNRTHVLVHEDAVGRRLTEIAPEIRIADNSSGETWGATSAWYRQDKEELQAAIDRWLKQKAEWIDIYNERPRFSLNTIPQWGRLLRQRQEAGHERAWYWHNQSPVVSPALALRDYFWRMYRENVSATLYWGAVMWQSRSEAETVSETSERRVWRLDRGFAAPRITGAAVGNGVLFWPGRNGVLASMRLEIYRDGVEDFDLMTLLEQRIAQLDSTGGHSDLIEQARQVLEIPDERLLPSLKVYPVNEPLRRGPHTPSWPHQRAFEQHRRRIVATLEQTREALNIGAD